jgi:hypothetical protein
MGLAELRAQSVRIELRRVRLAWDLDMILAAVFLLGTLWTTAAPLAAAGQSGPLSQPANTPPGAGESQTQGTATPTQNAPTQNAPTAYEKSCQLRNRSLRQSRCFGFYAAGC